MATIYLNLKDRKEENQFVGSDGKRYDKLWTIERKITGNMQLSGAMINGEARYVDGTVPTSRNFQEMPNLLQMNLSKNFTTAILTTLENNKGMKES